MFQRQDGRIAGGEGKDEKSGAGGRRGRAGEKLRHGGPDL